MYYTFPSVDESNGNQANYDAEDQPTRTSWMKTATNQDSVVSCSSKWNFIHLVHIFHPSLDGPTTRATQAKDVVINGVVIKRVIFNPFRSSVHIGNVFSEVVNIFHTSSDQWPTPCLHSPHFYMCCLPPFCLLFTLAPPLLALPKGQTPCINLVCKVFGLKFWVEL